MWVKSRRRMAFLWKINQQCTLKTCFNHPQYFCHKQEEPAHTMWRPTTRNDDMESSSRELLQYQKWSTGKGKVMIRTPRMVQQHQHSKTVRIIINKSRILDCALFCCKARRKRLEHERSLGRDTRCSALAAFCVLYNRTEHSQVFSVCFMIKNPINSSRITLSLTLSLLMTLSFWIGTV